jgi:hypothetical protein
VTLLPELVALPDEFWETVLTLGVGDTIIEPGFVDSDDDFHVPDLGGLGRRRVTIYGSTVEPSLSATVSNGIVLDGDASGAHIELESNEDA